MPHLFSKVRPTTREVLLATAELNTLWSSPRSLDVHRLDMRPFLCDHVWHWDLMNHLSDEDALKIGAEITDDVYRRYRQLNTADHELLKSAAQNLRSVISAQRHLEPKQWSKQIMKKLNSRWKSKKAKSSQRGKASTSTNKPVLRGGAANEEPCHNATASESSDSSSASWAPPVMAETSDLDAQRIRRLAGMNKSTAKAIDKENNKRYVPAYTPTGSNALAVLPMKRDSLPAQSMSISRDWQYRSGELLDGCEKGRSTFTPQIPIAIPAATGTAIATPISHHPTDVRIAPFGPASRCYVTRRVRSDHMDKMRSALDSFAKACGITL